MITRYKTVFLLPCLLCSSLAAMDSPTGVETPQSKGEAAALLAQQADFLKILTTIMEKLDKENKVYRYFYQKHLAEKLSSTLTALPETTAPFYTCMEALATDPRVQTQARVQFRGWEMDVQLVKKIFSAIDRLQSMDKPTPLAAAQFGANRLIALLSIAKRNPLFREYPDIKDMTRASSVLAKPLKLSAKEAAQMETTKDNLAQKLAAYETFEIIIKNKRR